MDVRFSDYIVVQNKHITNNIGSEKKQKDMHFKTSRKFIRDKKLNETKNSKIATKLICWAEKRGNELPIRDLSTKDRPTTPTHKKKQHFAKKLNLNLYCTQKIAIFAQPKTYLSNWLRFREAISIWIQYDFDIWETGNLGSEQTIEEWFKENIKALSSAENPFDLIQFRLKLKYTFGPNRTPFSTDFSQFHLLLWSLK